MSKTLELVETNYGSFIIDEKDLIGMSIKQLGGWERHLYEIYSKIINKEYHCIDAGANLGFHSIQFGLLGKKVYSFEPQRYIFNQLCSNILFNGLDNTIEPFRLGLGEIEEKQQMWNIEHEDWVGEGVYNWGGRGIIQDSLDKERAFNNEYREEDVINVIPLDSLNIPKCDFLKIDIQGYEYYMLKGAKNLISNFKPIIFLENHIGEPDSEDVKEYLVDLGYEFYRLHFLNKEDCILIHPNNDDYKKCLDIIKTFSNKYNIIKE